MSQTPVQVTRRELLTTTAKAAGLLALAQVGGVHIGVGRADAAEKLTLFVFSGLNLPVTAKEVAKAYMDANPGVTIEVLEGQNFEVYPKMAAARKLTPDQPLVHLGYSNTQFAHQGDIDDMWETIDPANVPNIKNIVPAYHRPANRGIGFSIAPVGLMYNTKLVNPAPTTWADMWGPRFRGKLTTIRYAWYMNGLVIAARLNGGSEKNIDAGFKLWADHADQFVAFANSNVDCRDLVVRGDAWMVPMFGGNVEQWKRDGAPVEFVIPKEGLIAFPLFLMVAKGVTPAQKKIAEGVINMILTDKWLARWAELTFYVPTTTTSVVSPALRSLKMYDNAEITRAIQFDWATITSNEKAWRERWDKEVVARMKS